MKTIFAIIVFLSLVSDSYSQPGENLLDNPGAESGFDYWATPNSDWGLGAAHTGSNGWAAGPITSTMYQTVDLLAKGYTPEVLDNSPSITTGIYVYPGGASGSSKGTITIKVELLNGSNGVISTTYISNNETLPLSMTEWTEKSTTITGYSAGMRKIRFTFIGLDVLGWEGYYGPVFDDANIQIDGPVPVELVSFTAAVSSETVRLMWSTAMEVNNYRFEIERAVISHQSSLIRWSAVGFIEGGGTCNSPKWYSFIEKNLSAGKYSYRLKQIDRDGKFLYSQTIEVTITSVPKVFALVQNYPNPFNPSTVISYQLPNTSYVTLEIYDAIGREVTILVNALKEAGNYSVTFDASKLSSGIYFARLQCGDKVQLKKMTLMK